MQIGNHHNMQLEEGMLRHMVLNSIRSYRSKFAAEYGELVLCTDGKKYWRKEIFPYYKANRKKMRAKSELDWPMIFNSLDKIREEIAETFPYKVIHIPTAEADDIIGTLCHEYGMPIAGGEQILILSADKDYIQLHTHANVKQYDPVRKRWVKHKNPEAYLKDHLYKGDQGDGVPNILSPDDTYVDDSKRAKPLRATKIEAWNAGLDLTDEEKRNFERNQKMIDLTYVPEDIKAEVLRLFEQTVKGHRRKLHSYFIKNKLKQLHEFIGDF